MRQVNEKTFDSLSDQHEDKSHTDQRGNLWFPPSSKLRDKKTHRCHGDQDLRYFVGNCELRKEPNWVRWGFSRDKYGEREKERERERERKE